MRNQEFYTKVPIPKKDVPEPEIDSSNWWYYVLGSILVVLIGPFVTSGNTIYNDHELVRMWTISAAIVLLLDIIFLWFLWMRPYLEKRKGYYWTGKFEVAEKESSVGFKYLRLSPGNAHKIKVSDNFFRIVRHGDKILVERNCLGEIKKIKRISGMRERIERTSHT